jgi:DNA-binding response OmpR family regulator
MNARILIVEDEAQIAELLELYFRREGADVRIAATGEEAIAAVRAEEPDLMILDINLPGIDGFDVMNEIRGFSSLPVIIVSAREADEDQIYGLGIGADEYVTKPISPKVLVAHVRALLRRRAERPAREVQFGPYRFDPQSYNLRRGDERVLLSAKEYDILVALVNAGGRPLRSEELYEQVWGNRYGDIATVGVYVQRLRRKLGDDPQQPRYIETIHGKGYRFGGTTSS